MKILVVYTGGTIGMVRDDATGVLYPGSINTIATFLSNHALKEQCELIGLSTIIDSSNFNKANFGKLASAVYKNYHQFDAFLILMGTDTMAYVASLLSFCITGLEKPILFSGGQKSLLEVASDSYFNFDEALHGLYNNQFPKEVGIYFAKQWHRAVLATKVDAQNPQAYLSPNKTKNYCNQKDTFSVLTQLSANVLVVKINPFQGEEVLLSILQQNNIDGLVLEVFGLGNIPEFTQKTKDLFKNKISKGFKVAVVSQCLYGGVSIGKYQTSLEIQSLGFLSAGAMTTEASVTKMMYLLEKKLNTQDFKHFFENSIRGESVCC